MTGIHFQTKKWFFLILVAVLASNWSCQDICCNNGDVTYGSGVVLEEIREVSTFHSVVIRGSCDFYFVQSVNQELRVITDDNILPLIITHVSGDGTLVIDAKSSYSSTAGVKVYASMVEIRAFTIAGSGSINGESPFSPRELNLTIAGSGNMFMNIRADRVWSAIAGSGSIQLMGRANYHNASIAGSGSLEAFDLIVSSYDIQLPGSGECRIHVEDVLNVVIVGSGNVYYRGYPSVVNTTIAGSGNVIHIG